MTSERPSIQTPRLLLRSLVQADASFYCRIYTDPDLMRQIGACQNRATAMRGFSAACASGVHPGWQRLFWLIELTAPGQSVGLLGLTRDPKPSPGAELGAIILPPWQGQGVATEAIASLVPYAFQELSIEFLHTRHRPDNQGASGLMKKAGFAPALPEPGSIQSSRWELSKRTGRALDSRAD